MSAQKKNSIKKESTKVEEPLAPCKRSEIKIFHSHEEQDEYKRKQMALLSPLEILTQLRQMINLAYGMHGYNPNKLPKKHSIKIIQKG